tara:strand:- start:8690 stop:9025 length:336 start_codon:yes stop_codon:yes gene_type:complete
MAKSPSCYGAFQHFFPSNQRWFTPGEFALAIGKSDQFVRDAINDGYIAALDFTIPVHKKKGRRSTYAIPREEAMRYILSCGYFTPDQATEGILEIIHTYGKTVRNKVKESL